MLCCNVLQGERHLTWWLGRIEQTLDTEGYAVGAQLSLADVYLYNALQEVWRLDEVEEADSVPQWRREPFGDLEAMDQKLSQVLLHYYFLYHSSTPNATTVITPTAMPRLLQCLHSMNYRPHTSCHVLNFDRCHWHCYLFRVLLTYCL